MAEGYYTLRSAAEERFTERRSVFIANAAPVQTEAAAIAFINDIKSRFSDATHNVYAYILREGNLSRFSDDGEPHGTAGLPVLDVLRKEQLCDCAVVVTRYFGGILLGAGGLVRAYSASAKLGVDSAVKVFFKPFDIFEMRMDYGRYNKIAKLMATHRALTVDSSFAEDVYIKGRIASERTGAFTLAVCEATNAAVSVELCGKEYGYEA